MQKPRTDLRPNTAEYETIPLVKATGFREYDARWILEKEINLLGIQALGLGLATYIHEIGQTRVASLICYEQLLMWPVILSLVERPDVLIAPANDWWANETNLPEIQRQSVFAWARLFGIPAIWSTNR